MKIGFFGESPADQAALAVFAEGILGEPPEPISLDLEARSVPGLFGALDAVIRGLHFNSDADGLVVAVDSDETELHDLAHEQLDADCGTCRYCRIRKIIANTSSRLKPRAARAPLKFAIGLAVPAIEAWYLVGRNHEVGEPAWRTALASGHGPPLTKVQLKQQVYQTARPSGEHATQRGVEEARRIIADLSRIETAFPMGFGRMAAEIRSWR